MNKPSIQKDLAVPLLLVVLTSLEESNTIILCMCYLNFFPLTLTSLLSPLLLTLFHSYSLHSLTHYSFLRIPLKIPASYTHSWKFNFSSNILIFSYLIQTSIMSFDNNDERLIPLNVTANVQSMGDVFSNSPADLIGSPGMRVEGFSITSPIKGRVTIVHSFLVFKY